MTGEAGALGELVGGAMLAGQFDGPAAAHGPATGDAAHGACANCDRTLHGHFCSHCGQAAHVTRSVAHLAEELLHGLTHFDGKAWRTLPALAFRPGRLTYDYIHGKRARFIAPMALFLFTVFLMFFVFGLIGGPDIDSILNDAKTPSAEARAELASSVTDLKGELADTEGDLADPDLAPGARAALTAKRAAQTQAIAAAEARLAQPAVAVAPASAPPQRWQDRLTDEVRSGRLKVQAPTPAIAARIRVALLNPDLALFKIQEKAYKLSFLLVPLSFPVLWLMFAWRRDVRSFDHIVFALYSLSFMSLLTVAVALLNRAGSTAAPLGTLASALLFAPPVHMFFQLKGAYRLGTGGALWRTAVLGVSSVITLGLFAGVILLVGLAD